MPLKRTSAAVATSAVESLERRTLLTVQLVTDIDTDTVGSDPSEFVAYGNGATFFTHQADGRYSLWRTDGTPQGTTLARADIPTWQGATFDKFRPVAAGGLVYFQTGTATGQYQLWASDGTPVGTRMLADGVKPGFPPNAYRGGEFVSFAGRVFFNATTAAAGTELWATDGTPEGTSLFADVVPGPTSADVRNLTVAGNYLFFETRENGQVGLWRTDGTSGGTLRLSQFEAGANQTAALNGKLLFAAGGPGEYPNQLWESDGSVAGTHVVLDLSTIDLDTPREFTTMNGALYFVARAGAQNVLTLWRSDGTASGTAPVVTDEALLNFGPFSLRAAGTQLFFYGSDATAGRELWRSDGTADGTYRVYDVNPGTASGVLNSPSVFPLVATAKGGTFFFADDGIHGSELWFSDGTRDPGATRLVKDVYPGFFASDLGEYTVLADGRLVFEGRDPTLGNEPYISDATTAGTAPLRDIDTRTVGSGPTEVIDAGGGRILVAARPPYVDENHVQNEFQRALFTVDPAAGANQYLAPDPPVTSETTPLTGRGTYQAATVGGQTYYFTNEVVGSKPVQRLQRTDGAPGGTGPFGTFYAAAGEVAVIGDRLYFTGSTDPTFLTGVGVYRTDGTAAGTQLVTQTTTGTIVHLATAPTGNLLYLSVGGDLYKISNADPFATHLAAFSGLVRQLLPVRHTIFAVHSSASGNMLSAVDDAGTTLGTNLKTVATTAVAYRGKVYFRSGTPSLLYVSDGTAAGTRPLAIGTGGKGLPAYDLAVVGDYLYFVANDGVHGSEWWRSDGTDAGTALWQDMVPGPNGSDPAGVPTDRVDLARSIIRWRGSIYFVAQTPAEGAELWRVNEEGNATPELVSDVFPGTTGSDPTSLKIIGGELYVVATGADVGRELYRVVDDVAPRLIGATFTPGGQTGGSLSLHVSEGVTFPTGAPVPTVTTAGGVAALAAGGSVTVTPAYDAATDTLTFIPSSPLADGNYRLTIPASWLVDASGNAPPADYTFDFFVLGGDANQDRAVDFNDLVKLAQNYNTTGKSWADGDFTGDGNVDFNDLVILAQRYNTSLPAPGATAAPAAAASWFSADWAMLTAPTTAPTTTKPEPKKAKPTRVFSVTPVPKPVPVKRKTPVHRPK